MKRTNEFEIKPQTDAQRAALLDLLDASAALWNEITYNRRQSFFDGEYVFHASNPSDRYKDVLSSSTAQQIPRKNRRAWKSFLTLNEKYEAGEVDEKPHPPGYWGNEEDGRELRTYIRNDQYTLRWGERSRLEIPIGGELEDRHDVTSRIRLEVAGKPKWQGEQGQLEIVYDVVSDTFRAIQPVTVPDSRQDSPLAEESAALDVGANNLVACTTTTGQQFLYEGRELFERFRETTERIAHLQSLLDDQRRTSNQIERLYQRRTDRRNHAQDGLLRDLVERLYEMGVATVYVGDLTDVLDTHWSVEVNTKTHNFWAFSRLIDRLNHVCEEYGITVVEQSEAFTTQTCPECGSSENTHRDGDLFRCDECGFSGHADLKASRVFLERETGSAVGSMARPVCLKWDDHRWSGKPYPHESPNEERTDRSTNRRVGKLAAGDSGAA
ncbi:MAG: transposase [Halobacteria archaeon]|nr:transposase [Halobacteria archaeon]